MRNKLNKMLTRKCALACLAIATALPSFEIIGSDIFAKLKEISHVDAASHTVNKDLGIAGYVSAQAGHSYFDTENTNVYSMPYENANGQLFNTVVINLTKPCASAITAYYRVENFTAIKDEDFEAPTRNQIVIPAGSTSVTVTINILESDTFKVTKSKNKDFYVTKCFKFILDSLQDAAGNRYEVYDGDDSHNGYRVTSGVYYKNSVLCSIGGKYFYNTVPSPYEGLENSKIRTFDDYYDPLSQFFGNGIGDKTKNTYDLGGVKDDGDDCRPTSRDGGGAVIVPEKYHSYYYEKADDFYGIEEKTYNTYRDWYARLVETGIANQYGSFTIEYFNGSRDNDAGKSMQMILGDYQFLCDAHDFNGDTEYADMVDTHGGKADHCNWNIDLNMNRLNGNSLWKAQTKAILKVQDYIDNYLAKGTSGIPDEYVDYVAGIGVFNIDKNPAADLYKTNIRIKYDNVPEGVEGDTIPWFKIPVATKESEFGFTIDQTHKRIFDTGKKHFNGYTYFSVLDDTTPVMVKDAAIELGSLNKDGKIKITVTYSEPVQCFEHTYFRGSLGNDAHGNEVLVTFRPVPGQLPGCSAIVYEADTKGLDDFMSKSLVIKDNMRSDAIPTGANEAEYTIRDFAQNGGNPIFKNETSNHLYHKEYEVNINRRHPNISFQLDGVNKSAEKLVSAKVKLTDFTGGRVYYTFVKDEGIDSEFVPTFSEKIINNETTYSYYKDIDDISDGSLVTLDMPSYPGRNGQFYCFAKVVSSLGLERTYPETFDSFTRVTSGFGPYNVDNIAPVIYVTPSTGENFSSMSRKFDIKVEENAAITTVDAYVQLKNRDDQPHHYEITLSKDMNHENEFSGSITLTLAKLINDYYTIKDTGAEMFDPPLNYEDFKITFSAKDRAGNSSTNFKFNGEEITGSLSYPLSKYPVLPGTMTVDKPTLVSEISDLNLYPIGTTFKFTSTIGDQIGLLETSVTKLPSKEDKVYRENYEDSSVIITQNSTPNNSEVTLLKPGYYEIVIKSKDGNYSESYKYYISDGLSEDTPNAVNANSPTLIPKMKVYQLNESSKQYYMDSNNSFHAQSYNGTNEPIFSDKSRAYSYIFAHEYEDMELLQVNSQNITFLNNTGGSSNIKRASTETKDAEIGDWWVRYKDEKWSLASQTSASWGYYYYSESIGNGKTPTITEEQCSSNQALYTEMGNVARILSENGQTIYLVDANHIDLKTGSPKLTEKQIEISRGSTILTTFSGNAVNAISVTPDNELYNNTVAVRVGADVIDYPLATNMPLKISDSTTLYVATNLETNNYRKITCEDGTLLRDAINIDGEGQSGIYRLLEIDDMGASVFDVYVDKQSPYINIERTIYDETIDDTKSISGTVGSELTSNFYSQTFTITGQSYSLTTEIDPEAYVVVYKKGKFQTFRFLNNFVTPILLEDGIYDVTVGDRSGNSYSFKVYASDEPIAVSFKASPNGSRVTISTTNREDSEILKFDVYCNGDLVSQDLSSTKEFTMGGTYYAVIQDQYGNSITTESFMFTKQMPEIELYYIDGISSIKYRESDNPPHIIKTVGDDSITLSTNSLLKITYQQTTTGISVVGYDDTFYKLDDEHGTLTMTEPRSFSFRLYFKGNEDEYVLYNVIYDGQNPTINGTYSTVSYDLLDEDPLNNDINTSTPNSLDYQSQFDYIGGQAATKQNPVIYGSSFIADVVHFTVSDNTLVSRVEVTRDGTPIDIKFADQGFNGLEFYIDGKPGKYEVKAYDVFGQVSTQMFYIIDETFTDAKVDGETVLPFGPLGQEGSKIIYGHNDFNLDISNNSSAIVIYDGKEGRHAFCIDVSTQGVYVSDYLVYVGEDGELAVDSFVNPKQITSTDYYPIDGVNLLIKINNDKSVTLTYVAEDNTSTIETRVSKNDSFYNLYRVEFSKEMPVINEFKDGQDSIVPVNGYIYCSEEARLENIDANITSILVAYNPEEDNFTNSEYVEYTDAFVHGQGFYHFIITNKYGNTVEYTAVISNTITGFVTESYLEKDSQTYSLQDSKDCYYSNKEVTITGYNVKRLTEENNNGSLSGNLDKMTLTLSNPGTYKVTFIDANNNKKVINVVIGTEEFSYDESWLTGYNDKALLKDQGYTNQKLSFDLETSDLLSEGIEQIYVVYNNEKTILYGYVDEENSKAYVKEDLEGFIGSKGDGIYYVYFSNKYGDVCVKEIHYQVAPTLEIERTTNLDIVPEKVLISDALVNGIWANQKVKFSSTLNSTQYQFYVKSGETAQYQAQPINYLFELASTSNGGEVYYFVKYIDAYGNEYEFKVNLLKRDVNFDTSKITTLTSESVTYTRSNFTFEFDPDDVSIEYKFNGSQEYYKYSPNQIIFKDGIYEFHMFDKAGNQAVYILTKDSYVNFDVKVKNQPGSIFFGQAVNATSVEIVANSNEGLEYASIKLNGRIIDKDDFELTKAGHYEFIMKDKLGNIRYFHFYLISNELAVFDYEIPDDYIVTSAYYTNPQGIKVTSMDKVSNGHVDLNNAAEGTYEVQIKNVYDNSVSTFAVKIDKRIPTAELVGCADGDTTTKTIELSNLQKGDIVTVYKDGEIIEQVQVNGTETMSKITEGGSYHIVVESKAGTTQEFNFEKLTIANGALSALIIIGLLGVAGGFFAVLILRNNSKNDE